jgi:D-alanyl-D-alanine carboxypeptidase/D-alanyl-D-alanine-endopeptidase (penicillin-binding protein 4)
MKRLLLALLFLLSLPALGEVDPPPAVIQALKASDIPLPSVAIVVHPLDAAAPLISFNAGRSLNPASVMKLVTTYAALDLLGPAHTWKTGAYIDTEPAEGRLPGNLYIKGSGDPKLALEHFWALLRQLRVRGISHIAGDVVLDRSAFEVPPAAGDFDDKPMRPYNVGPDALLVNFRALRFVIQPFGDRVRLILETPGDGLPVENRMHLLPGDCKDNWKDRINVRLLPETGGLEFTGGYSAQCGERVLNLAPLPADRQVGSLFAALWRELGGTLAGRVRGGGVPAGARLAAEQESPVLADMVRDINKFSNNVMARQLFLALGNGDGPATPEKAMRRVAAWLVQRNLAFRELEMENGSGLSRRERISADSLDRLLLDAWYSPVMPEFVASLPVVGIDGTMKKRLLESGARGRGHIKTGTLEGVKSAAGYVMDSRGRRYAVTFLINHPRARDGQAAIDALLQWVAERR